MKRLILGLVISLAALSSPVIAQELVPTPQEAAYLALLAKPDADFIPLLKGPRETSLTGEVLNPKIQWVLENESRPLATDAMRSYFRQSFASEAGRATARANLDRYWDLRTLKSKDMKEVRALSIPTRAGQVAARLYLPQTDSHRPLPLLVYYHGGGFAFGSVASFDKVARLIANDAQMMVVSVDYRLAPENPYPAAFDDAEDSFDWVYKNAKTLGADPHKVSAGGDSAGATLALSLTQRRFAAKKSKPSMLLLFYPGVNIKPDFPSMKAYGNGYGLDQENLKYLAGLIYPDPKTLRLSDISPVNGNLCANPPMHVVTAGFDPLLDSQLDFVEKVKAKGIYVSTSHLSGSIHGFLQMTSYVDDAKTVAEASLLSFGQEVRKHWPKNYCH